MDLTSWRTIVNLVGVAKPTTKLTLHTSKPKKANCVHILSNAPIVEESIRQTQ